MKHVAPFILFLLFYNASSAQYCGNISGPGVCTPQGNSTSPGFSPSCNQLPPIINNQYCSTVIQFVPPDTLGHPDGSAIDSLLIYGIDNLPPGLCWCTNSKDNTVAAGQPICILISGFPCGTPGQYELNITFGAKTVGSPNWSSSFQAFPWFGYLYFLRLNNPGEPEVPIDISQINPTYNYIWNYGPATVCPYPHLEFGDTLQACKNSQQMIDYQLTGGTPPFTYQWSTTGDSFNCYHCDYPNTTVTQTTNYALTVTDFYGNVATASSSYTVSTDNELNRWTLSNTGINCTRHTDTTVFNMTQGPLNYLLIWGDNSNPDWDVATASVTHVFSEPGIYWITLWDSAGCYSSSFLDTVPGNGVIISMSNAHEPTCAGIATGNIAVTATGGSGAYTYLWSTGQSTAALSNIMAGTYTVTVTDASNCTGSFSYNLNSISPSWQFYTYLNENPTNCSNNGSIQSTTSGGISPYTYNWSNGASSANLSGLAGGTYSLTVTDSVGCATSGNIIVPSSCVGYLSGTAFNDINGNCSRDSGETGLPSIIVAATSASGITYYANTSPNGSYLLQLGATGQYTLQAAAYPGSGNSCAQIEFCNISNQTFNLAAAGDTGVVNVAVTTGVQSFDLGIFPEWTSANPGFIKEYRINYYNNSPRTYNNPATLTFAYDSNLIFQASTGVQPTWPAPANYTLVWNLDSVPAYSWGQVVCYFQVPPTLSLSYLLQSNFSISPTASDCDTSNNHARFSEIVTGSHDPNEKTVEPANLLSMEDSVLTYTIHFQNNGTDSTHFIIVKDTLSPNLNPATVRNIACSSKFSNFSISGKGILTWTFNPLRLPDSSTNANTSKGFITFSVNKASGLPLGALISNTAYIYFDYNTPVVTNTVTDTLGLVQGILPLETAGGISVRAYPNPFKDATNIVVTGVGRKYDFELFDVTGRLLHRTTHKTPDGDASTTQFRVQRNELAAGMYMYRIVVNGAPVANGKLVVE